MRSKRRSGRGPVTVVSTNGQQEDSIDSTPAAGAIEWIWADEGTRTSDVSGMTYPEIINLTDKSGKFDLVIEPLFGLTEVNDALGPRLRQAVQVSGSHDGKGFLEFQPPLPD